MFSFGKQKDTDYYMDRDRVKKWEIDERLYNYKKIFNYEKQPDSFELENREGFIVEIIPRNRFPLGNIKHVLTATDEKYDHVLSSIIDELIELIENMISDNFFEDENITTKRSYITRIICNGKLIYSNKLSDRCH